MATGRSNKPVQMPGQAQQTTTDTQEQAAQNNLTLPSAGEESQYADSSQQQAGAMGHPAAASVGAGETGEAGGGEETVTISKDALNVLLARVEALEGAAQNKIAKGSGVVKTRLPDQDDVDPKKITQPQLSEQGWVLPHNFGANPNGNKI